MTVPTFYKKSDKLFDLISDLEYCILFCINIPCRKGCSYQYDKKKSPSFVTQLLALIFLILSLSSDTLTVILVMSGVSSTTLPTSHRQGDGVARFEAFTFPRPRAPRAPRGGVSKSSGRGVITSSLTSISSVQIGLMRPNFTAGIG